ncbi:hypothetical protein FLL45_00095 [Aliikangiella marina]|uniref:Uncharacterized protein n=1 Tax=Aliikangiella marina TaxID=1712262 RepID=A0A545TGP1_9GAMM|nr:hypothetical protein [Aliikangiella marina]TQV76404.1 hypothetical protein FLL45_00095 [Aliikangiella marina]
MFNLTNLRYISLLLMVTLSICGSSFVLAESSDNTDIQENQSKNRDNKDNIKLKTLTIQGNKELPKVLFIVPWQDPKKKKGSKSQQRLVLHSLYGDLFDPMKPSEFNLDLKTDNQTQE